MACGGGGIHYRIISLLIRGTCTVLLNMKIGGLIITLVMTVSRSPGLSSAVLPHTELYL